MALQKTLELSSGISGNYWRIVSRDVNYLSSTILVVLYQYIDDDARLANKDCLTSRTSTVSFTPGNEEPTRALIYPKLKAQDAFFTDAVDC